MLFIVGDISISCQVWQTLVTWIDLPGKNVSNSNFLEAVIHKTIWRYQRVRPIISEFAIMDNDYSNRNV